MAQHAAVLEDSGGNAGRPDYVFMTEVQGKKVLTSGLNLY